MTLLEASGVTVHDRRRALLDPTSLTIEGGGLLLVYGDPGHGHTALALALAGRLDQYGGTVTLDGSPKRRHLQRSVALVDVPGVSEPDDNLPLTTIVGEELAMAGRPASRMFVRFWLAEHGLANHLHDRMEDLATVDRVTALARLAALRPGVEFLVLTLPERHGELPSSWLDTARSLADDGFGVLVTTSTGVAQQLDVRRTPLGGAVELPDSNHPQAQGRRPMTSLRMALTELRRIASGRLPRMAVIALALIPTLYGGLYLYANHDPYGNLKHVPAALVVLDTGATDQNGKPVHAGSDVATQLVQSRSFDWHEVSAAQASKGVHDGRYDFALTIPRDFSAALTSSARFDPRQAQLQMTTNDANSYLSTTIADQVTVKVRDALAQQVGTQAATSFLVGLSQIRGSLTTAAAGAGRLTDGLATARSGSQQLAAGAGRLATGATALASGLGTIEAGTSALPGQTRQLADGARQVAAGNREIARTGDEVGAVASQLTDDYSFRRADLAATMDELGLTANQQSQLLAIYDRLGAPVHDADAKVQQTVRDLDRLSRGADEVANGNSRLASGIPTLVDGIRQARTGATKVAAGATQLKGGATQLDAGLVKLHAGSARLGSGLQDGVDQIPATNDTTRDRIATTIGNPVDISSAAQTRASSYGAGLAPFFMALAAWIGGYVLFLLVRPLSNRAMAANQTPLRVAVAGWATPALIGLVQMTALLAVVLLAIRIVPADIVGTWLFMLLMSATFVAIVHSLNAWLGSAGQFLGLVLMVLQLVTAGGTFPWQTIPQPMYWLHHVLPMSYGVDGLRQLMYGGLDSLVIRDALVLVVWFVAALVATSLAARKQRVWSVKRIKPELAI